VLDGVLAADVRRDGMTPSAQRGGHRAGAAEVPEADRRAGVGEHGDRRGRHSAHPIRAARPPPGLAPITG
jgi:hypothetical protein